jgi:prephenate dehydratase
MCAADTVCLLAERRLTDIASRVAAREFGLDILDPSFQDPQPNYNRYLQNGLESITWAQPF